VYDLGFEALPPNTALQLTDHSAFQSLRGTIWLETLLFRALTVSAVWCR
jgi:hypothetical protein